MRFYKFLLESNTPEKPKEFKIRYDNPKRYQIEFLDTKTNDWYMFMCTIDTKTTDNTIWEILFKDREDTDSNYLEKKTKNFSSVWKHVIYFLLEFIKFKNPETTIWFKPATEKLKDLYNSPAFKGWFSKQTSYVFDKEARLYTFRRP